MNTIFRICLTSFLSLSLLCSCSSVEGDIDSSVESTQSTDSETFTVNLKYTIADMAAGTAECRALTRGDVDADGIRSDIQNILVVQFNGAEESSTVSSVDYLTNLTDPEVQINETSVRTIILFLANTFDGTCVSVGETLAKVKSAGIALSGNVTQTDNGIIYDESLVRSDSNGNKYFMFSDCKIYENGVYSGEDIEINLQRNVARVSFSITNGWQDQTLNSLSIASIPSSYLYYANRQSEADGLNVPTTVSGTTSYNDTIDRTVGDLDEPPVTEVSFYVPVNMRGYDEESTETTKPKSTCAVGATYARIGFIYTYADKDAEEVTEIVYYTLYLGADLSNDFNLRPNTYYAYNITFYGKGDNVDSDARITVMETVEGIDYTDKKSANCYILNPSETGEVSYYIPIATRINEYWTEYEGSTAPITNGDIESWEFDILWYDNSDDPYSASSENLSNQQLCIEKVSVNDIASLKITLGMGFDNDGNVLVAVTQDGSILWSWHLWITDYNPYNHGYTATESGAYAVTGGAVHRYSDGTADGSSNYLWSSGLYKDKYIMDRNLGARSAPTSTTLNTTGALYYQYGRKDPFRHPNVATVIRETSSTTTIVSSVLNPTTFYNYSGSNFTYWNSEDNSTSYIWNDKYFSSDNKSKSIFDPSPYGWRVPIYGVWSDFSADNFSSYIYNNFAYYPSANTISAGVIANYDCYYFTATLNSPSHAHAINAGKVSSTSSPSTVARATALPIRCVEDEAE